MVKRPLLSFVMPVFQAQVWVAESIQSVLNQKLKNIELIVVNDCSTDASREIIEHFVKKDSRVRCIDLDVNGGMSNARNVGNQAARAKIIAVQDADDLSYPDRAENIVKFFDKNKKDDVFYSTFTLINSHGHPQETYGATNFDIDTVMKLQVTCIGHPTVAYRKKVILEHPYQNGEWSRLGCEDFRLITELWKTGHTFGFSGKTLVLYRWHSTNSSQTRNTQDVIKLKKEYIETYLKGAEHVKEKDAVPAY